jgi:hypothetical protein
VAATTPIEIRTLMRLEIDKIREPLVTLKQLSRCLGPDGADICSSLAVVLLRVCHVIDALEGDDPLTEHRMSAQ